MLKLTIHDIQENRTLTRFGTEAELLRVAREVASNVVGDAPGLDEAVGALNDTGFFTAKVESAHPPAYGEHNLLPEDYLTHEEGEDPWVREADLK